ncbi:MAG: heme ABC exporter ATP-binding protein CcmA [Zetaproteobacteria bacterium]|nr:heme ABC exporter ATP-binding protein CcmA [Pseudobdellovibrionaceae bacterium]
MLKIENLCFSYQFRPLIRNLSFEINKGELCHVIGPNGCGKTTLISIIAGLLSPNTGSISWQTKSDGITKGLAEVIEYLPSEANSLYAKMDATTNLRFWAQLRGMTITTPEIFAELEKWDLNHPLVRENFATEKFSTGMKRRLALARVALSKTPFWLMDEPLYGLDTKGIETFQHMLKKHLNEGGACLVVSHDVAPLAPLKPKKIYMTKEQETK